MGYLDPSFVQNLFGIPQIVDPFSVEGIQLAANPTGVPSPMWGVQQNAKVQAPQQKVPPQISALPANKVIQNLMSIESKQQKKQLLPDSVYEQLKKRQLDSFKEQKQGIQDFESGLQAPQEINPLLAITSGLSDMFAGTNRLEGLSRQKAMQEVQAKEDQRYLQAMKKDLTKAEIDMLKSQFQHEQDTDKLGMTMRLAREKMAAESGTKLSPYQEAKQKELGKTQAEFITKDRGVLTNNLDKVSQAIERLNSGEVSTGTLGKTIFPEWSGAFDTPYAATKADIQSAITDTLKPTLGAQFTEKEGERIKALTFDPKQPPEENARRATQLHQFIQKKIQFQDAFGAYLDQNNGSDRGFPYENYGMRKSGTATNTPSTTNKVLSKEEWIKAGRPK